MSNNGFMGSMLKYLVLTVIVYVVASNIPSSRLEKNDVLALSISISILFAVIDMYGGVFKNLLNLICDCKNKK